MRHLPARLLTAAVVGLLVAGCGAGHRLAAPARVVDVTERDFAIKVSQRNVAAGTVVFRATNRGPDAHELIIARVHRVQLPLRTDGLTVSEEGLENMKLGYDAIFISALNPQSLLPLSRRISEMLEGTGSPQALSLERDAELITPVRAVS